MMRTTVVEIINQDNLLDEAILIRRFKARLREYSREIEQDQAHSQQMSLLSMFKQQVHLTEKLTPKPEAA